MEMKELFLLEEFQRYRRREIEIAAEFVKRLWGGSDPQYVRGAVDILSKILAAPEGFAKTPETKDWMQTLTARDFALFETEFLRRIITKDEEE
jgi:hypothetical protein